MKSRVLQLVFSVFFIFCTSVFCQTVHQVTAGVDQVSVAIAAASEGDTIELTTDGGVYTETAGLVVDKALTIRAAEGLSNKPVLITDDELATIIISGDFTLKGIYLDGSQGALGTLCGIIVADGTLAYTLEVNNCEFWSFRSAAEEDGSAIYGTYYPATQATSVSIIDCIFADIQGSIVDFSYADASISEEGACLDMFVINSTFWGLYDNEAIYCATNGDGSGSVGNVTSPMFYVDHCTFVNVGSKAIYPKYIDGASISNSISVNNEQYAARIYGSLSGIRNFLWWNCPDEISYYDASDPGSDATDAQGVNVINSDPLFADADYLTTGNFELSDTSPALNQDDDGNHLGDPRWYPGANTGIEETLDGIPGDFQLHQNYPNPFNPSTTIEYSISEPVHVTLKVYNVLGKELKTLINREHNSGNYSVKFNAADLANGIYFYKITAGNYLDIKKMVLLK